MIPSSGEFVVDDLQLCESSYNINLIFSNKLDLLTWLNNVFVNIYGYTGLFTIDSNSHLIYTTSESCLANTSCLKLGCWLSDETGLKVIITEDNINYIKIENC